MVPIKYPCTQIIAIRKNTTEMGFKFINILLIHKTRQGGAYESASQDIYKIPTPFHSITYDLLILLFNLYLWFATSLEVHKYAYGPATDLAVFDIVLARY